MFVYLVASALVVPHVASGLTTGWTSLVIDTPDVLANNWPAEAEFHIKVEDNSETLTEWKLPIFSGNSPISYSPLLLGLFNDTAEVTFDIILDPSADPLGPPTLENLNNIVTKDVDDDVTFFIYCDNAFACDDFVRGTTTFTADANTEITEVCVSIVDDSNSDELLWKVTPPKDMFVSHISLPFNVSVGVSQFSVEMAESGESEVLGELSSWMTSTSYTSWRYLTFDSEVQLNKDLDMSFKFILDTSEIKVATDSSSCSSGTFPVKFHGHGAVSCKDQCAFVTSTALCIEGCERAHPDYLPAQFCSFTLCSESQTCELGSEQELAYRQGCTLAKSYEIDNTDKTCVNLFLEDEVRKAEDGSNNLSPTQVLFLNNTATLIQGSQSAAGTAYHYQCPTSTLAASQCEYYVCSRGEWVGLGSQIGCEKPACSDVCTKTELLALLQLDNFHAAMTVIDSDDTVPQDTNVSVSCDQSSLGGLAEFVGESEFGCRAKDQGGLGWVFLSGDKMCNARAFTDTTQTQTSVSTTTSGSRLSADAYRQLGYDIFQMNELGFTVQEVYDAGYPLFEIRLAFSLDGLIQTTIVVTETTQTKTTVITTKGPPTTQVDATVPVTVVQQESKSDDGSTTELVGLIVLILVIVVAVPMIIFLVYRIRKRREEKRWERENQLAIPLGSRPGQAGTVGSPPNNGGTRESYIDNQGGHQQGVPSQRPVRVKRVSGLESHSSSDESFKKTIARDSIRGETGTDMGGSGQKAKKIGRGSIAEETTTDSVTAGPKFKTFLMGSVKGNRGETGTDDAGGGGGMKKKKAFMMGSRKYVGESGTDSDGIKQREKKQFMMGSRKGNRGESGTDDEKSEAGSEEAVVSTTNKRFQPKKQFMMGSRKVRGSTGTDEDETSSQASSQLSSPHGMIKELPEEESTDDQPRVTTRLEPAFSSGI